jgi:hypothetical protein
MFIGRNTNIKSLAHCIFELLNFKSFNSKKVIATHFHLPEKKIMLSLDILHDTSLVEFYKIMLLGSILVFTQFAAPKVT